MTRDVHVNFETLDFIRADLIVGVLMMRSSALKGVLCPVKLWSVPALFPNF